MMLTVSAQDARVGRPVILRSSIVHDDLYGASLRGPQQEAFPIRRAIVQHRLSGLNGAESNPEIQGHARTQAVSAIVATVGPANELRERRRRRIRGHSLSGCWELKQQAGSRDTLSL